MENPMFPIVPCSSRKSLLCTGGEALDDVTNLSVKTQVLRWERLRRRGATFKSTARNYSACTKKDDQLSWPGRSTSAINVHSTPVWNSWIETHQVSDRAGGGEGVYTQVGWEGVRRSGQQQEVRAKQRKAQSCSFWLHNHYFNISVCQAALQPTKG